MRERSFFVLKLSRNRQIPSWDIACWWLEMLSFDDEQVIPVWSNVWTASSLRILGQVDVTVTFVKLNISWSFPYVLFLQWGVHMLIYMCSSSLSYIHYFCNEERTCPLCSLMRESSVFCTQAEQKYKCRFCVDQQPWIVLWSFYPVMRNKLSLSEEMCWQQLNWGFWAANMLQ